MKDVLLGYVHIASLDDVESVLQTLERRTKKKEPFTVELPNGRFIRSSLFHE
jgi:hypothetical protein